MHPLQSGNVNIEIRNILAANMQCSHSKWQYQQCHGLSLCLFSQPLSVPSKMQNAKYCKQTISQNILDSNPQTCPSVLRNMKALLTSLVHAGQDIFGRGFKFLWFYKRGGHRVILNKKGDLIVRPSPLEASLRLQPFSQFLKAHLLSSYLRSIAAAVMREYSHGSTSDRSSLLELIDRNKLLWYVSALILKVCHALFLCQSTSASSRQKARPAQLELGWILHIP